MEASRGLSLVMAVLCAITAAGEAQLTESFYASTCPSVEAVVSQTVATKVSQTFTTIPATLRLFFHDCFVEVANPDLAPL